MRPSRLIPPVQSLEQYANERLGLMQQRDIVQEIEEAGRRTPVTPSIPVVNFGPWYRANVGASGDAAYTLRIGTPSSDSAWAMTPRPLPMPMAGRVMGGFIWASGVVTAGTATLQVQIVDTVGTRNIVIPDCALDAVTWTSAASQFLVDSTIRFSRTATIQPRILTAGTLAPTTLDMGAIVFVQFD